MSDVRDISPAELAADIIRRLGTPIAVVKVGPATDAEQQTGVISIMNAGLPAVDLYTPTTWMRAQIRCLHGTLGVADAIANQIYADHQGRGRTVARMASTDKRYLIHIFNVTAGPSHHYDSPETWETLLFAEIMLGTDPLD